MSGRYIGKKQPTPSVEYLVVAGGGAGPSNSGSSYPFGGGGAGGFLQASGYLVTPGSSITVTVGAGGATFSNGTNSEFGSIITIGGGYGNGWPGLGGAGGSSGGTCNTSTGAPVAGQGNTGGISDAYCGPGGGGAGSAARNYTGSGPGGNGGAGVVSTITGVPVQYAGGGGGGSTYYGTNPDAGYGSAGGGDGGVNLSSSYSYERYTAAQSGGSNTGGGGGAAGTANPSVSSLGTRGGSGIVVIRYPSWYARAASTTGSPQIYISGKWLVYIWTNSGSITF